MGMNLHDLLGEDGELLEPLPPRKSKEPDRDPYKLLLQIVIGVIITVISAIFIGIGAMLFGGNDDTSRETFSATQLAMERASVFLSLTQTALAPTNTATPNLTQTFEADFSAALTQTALAPTATATPTSTFTPSNTPTDTPSATLTFTPSNTPTPSDTPTATLTFTPSNTPTQTFTPTPSYQGVSRANAPLVNSLGEWRGHTTAIRALAWSPDGQYVASAGEYTGQEAIWIWDVATGQPTAYWTGHDKRINSLAWSSDGRWVASGGDDETVRLWDAHSGQQQRLFEGFDSPIDCVAISAHSQFLAANSQNGTVTVWQLPNGDQKMQLGLESGGANCVAWSPNNLLITVGTQDAARIWDIQTRTQANQLAGPIQGRKVVWSGDGRWIATQAGANVLELWDAVTGQEIAQWNGRNPAWSPDNLLIAGDYERYLRIWDAESSSSFFGGELVKLEGHTGSISIVVWSPDGRRLVSGGEDRVIRLWGLP